MNVRESLYSLLCRTIGKLLKSTKILPTMFPAIKSKPSLLQNNRHIKNPKCKTKHFFLEDIALITLKKGFTLSHKINPACVPPIPLASTNSYGINCARCTSYNMKIH